MDWFARLTGFTEGPYTTTRIRRAVAKVTGFDLDVRLVSYGQPSAALRELVKRLG